MGNCALYHRVSRADQDETLAREELRAAAAARGLTVSLDVEETGSGARNDRPGLLRVLDAARRGKIQAVLTWKLDRWGRSVLDVLANLRALQDSGCRFIATSQGLDVRSDGDAVSKLQVNVLAAVAEFERDLIREPTRLGLDQARRAGKRLGRPRAKNAPDPATVTSMRKRRLSWGQIAKQLGCSQSAARRAFARVENGVENSPPISVENASAE